mgnify:CR=1 FL=1
MKTILIAAAVCGLLLALAWAAASAQTAPNLDSWTVDGGGGTMDGSGPAGAYTLTGSVGQPDAGVLEGSGFTLNGGFIGGGLAVRPEYPVYLPLVIRNR